LPSNVFEESDTVACSLSSTAEPLLPRKVDPRTVQLLEKHWTAEMVLFSNNEPETSSVCPWEARTAM
jgi:hypothetical protein